MTFNKQYADVYSLIYGDKDYRSESDFVGRLLEANHPMIEKVLEFGCGTGSYTRLLAEMGYSITGVDLSPDMIELARSGNSHQKIDYEVGDMTAQRDSSGEFDAVIVLFSSITYLRSYQELNAFISTAYKALKPGGLVLFDYWFGPSVLNDPPGKRCKVAESEELFVLRETDPVLDVLQNTVHVNFDFHVINKSNVQYTRFQERHSVRYFFLLELIYLFESGGFRHRNTRGWMKDDPPALGDWYAISLFEKPGDSDTIVEVS